MTKLVKNKTLDLVMMEKYLHSQGAALCGEGRFDEAIDMLRDAISIEDQPYTRYQLSHAYLGKGDLEKALEEISHAIALNNSIPEYYYERKEMWLLKGDVKKARIDNEKMLRLDKYYSRIRDIQHAARIFCQVFQLAPAIVHWMQQGFDKERFAEQSMLIHSCSTLFAAMLRTAPAFCRVLHIAAISVERLSSMDYQLGHGSSWLSETFSETRNWPRKIFLGR